MRMGLIAIAACLTVSGAAHAEPAKAPAAQADQPHSEPAKAVVLAAAETVKASSSDAAEPTSSQPRHRLGRVTTCRCGDPAPGDTVDDNPRQ